MSFNNLTVTHVALEPVVPADDVVKARVSIVLNGALAVHDLKVFESPEGLFLAMPVRRDRAGEFRSIVHFLSNRILADVERVVVEAYQRTLPPTAPCKFNSLTRRLQQKSPSSEGGLPIEGDDV